MSEYKFTVLKILSRKIFDEFMGFYPKGFNPLKLKQIQIGSVSWIFISKSIWNLNFFPKEKLFLLNLSSTLQN
jgi:hypothetical protein